MATERQLLVQRAASSRNSATLLREFPGYFYILLIAPVAIYAYRFYVAAQSRANAILVGPRQFPELFATYQELGRRLEMPHLPRLPRIIAHRCGGSLAPENTLAGLRASIALGCAGVEFDVMLSADGSPWVIHDETLERTTDGTGTVEEKTVGEVGRLARWLTSRLTRSG